MTDSPRDRSETEAPHDVLAAEEFPVPRPEPGVPHDRDPRPHDVLAAEEFAMPAPGEGAGAGGRSGSLPWVAAAAGAALALFAKLRGRRRRSRRR